ncbi:hypothetical protein [Actinoallomurus iriomotensis]|uniref:Uncharacterized protein n=1 Tax=Actinoallomurus iriomotensis TaxID=478107 RepID=A0A9W6SF08_9ACTN|nr:hypothetical protein [Actinoallomurus iriomotensis]GLY91600.1 hypothetical protein Airi02_095280 [Actinoallomurus iriomotensis]
MALRRDRRVAVASATLSAGALVFFAAQAGPASAATGRTTVGECRLGRLLCGLLGAGKGVPGAPPRPSAKPSSRPSAEPPPKHRHKAAKRPAPRSRHQFAVRRPVDLPAPPAGARPDVSVPESSPAPALPDVPDRDPVVVPRSTASAPAERLAAEPALLVAESAPDGEPLPPLLVATASGLIGALAALNLSLLFRRRDR